MNVRLLTLADRDQLFEVYHSQSTLMKVKKNEDNILWFQNTMDQHLFHKKDDKKTGELRIFGAFKDGQLISCVGQWDWNYMPYWTANCLMVRKEFSNTLNLEANGLGPCFDQAAQFAEEHRRFTFFWATDAARWNTRERIWSKSTQTFKRYVTLIERVIKAGHRPPWNFEFVLMGRRTWDRDLVLKSAHLKKGYRHQYFKSEGLIDEDFVDLQGNGTWRADSQPQDIEL